MNKPNQSSRARMIADVFQTGASLSDEWPHADYALAAAACAASEAAREKHRQLVDDLESIVILSSGPSSFPRLAHTPADVLKPLAGRCWREILTDAGLSPRIWTALRYYSQVLKAEVMDDASRRMGIIIHAVAIARLEAAGAHESDPKKRKRHQAEREFVIVQPFVPGFIVKILNPQRTIGGD